MRRGIFVSRRATRHLGLLAAFILLVLAFGAWLQIPQLLTSASGVVAGASYTDVHARIPAQYALVAAAVLSALLALWQAMTVGRLWPIGAAAGLYVLVSLGGSAYAAIIQRFVVAPTNRSARRRSSPTTSRRRVPPTPSTTWPRSRSRARRR